MSFIQRWTPESYGQFVEENMALINEQYSLNYAPIDFIVDLENGSTPIQNLIDPSVVLPLLGNLMVHNIKSHEEIIQMSLNYVKHEFQFTAINKHWKTVAETIQIRKGDCKNLSLVLLSLLLAADIEAYAAISNGHMWVMARCENRWKILEVDDDSERKRIYSIAGFYDAPLYRVFLDHTEKRLAFTAF